jgi:Uma2 family endonuclease
MTASDEEEPMTATLHLPDLDRQRQDWTVDDLASLPEDLRYELIDGRLILPSPTGIHQIVGVDLVLALRAHCPADYAPVPDLSLKIDKRNEPRPDVVVVRRDQLHVSPVPVEDAILAVEVLSPTSLTRDTYAKLRVYAAARVAHYWIVEPLNKDGIVLIEYRRGDNGVYDLVSTTDKVFTTEEPYPITIDLPALTAQRDATPKRARAKR